MNSKAPWLLALIGLLLASGTAWLLLVDSENDALSVSSVDHAESNNVERDSAVLSTPDVVPAVRNEAPAPVSKPAAAPIPKRISHVDSIWIEGRILFPEGTPADERVTVVAHGWRFAGKEKDPKQYETQVGQDGYFRVAFAKRTKRGKLSIKAKYLYLEQAVKLSKESFEEEVVIEPLLGGCIEITLIPPSAVLLTDEDIEGCYILGYSPDGSSQAIATHAEGPAFLASAFVPCDHYQLSLSSNRFLNCDLFGSGVKPGEVTQVEFELVVGANVAGRVVDVDGKPVDEVQLEFEVGDDLEFAFTGERGEFEKGGLEGGLLSITASKKGFLRQQHKSTQLVEGESAIGVEIVLTRGRSVTGVVIWPDGNPVAEIEVFLEQEGSNAGGTVMTGADGGFTFTGLRAGACTIGAQSKPTLKPLEGESERKRKRREKAQAYWQATFRGVVPSGAPLTLVLREGQTVPGVVVDDSGEAILKFNVTVRPLSKSSRVLPRSGRTRLKVKDSIDGSFLLRGLEEGDYDVHVTAMGHTSLAHEIVSVPWSGGTLRFVLRRTASLSGVVLDSEGRPIQGARADLAYRSYSGDGFTNGGKHEETDEQGEFTLQPLRPTRCRIRAEAAGYARGEWVTVELVPGEQRTDVVLSLRAGATLTGTIHPSVGKISGIEVDLQGLDGGGSKSAVTGSNGEFRFEVLDPGRYKLWMSPDMSDMDSGESGYQAVKWSRRNQVEIHLAEGERLNVVLGESSDSLVRVSGVVSAGGVPAAGELVSVRLVGQARNGPEVVAHTDATGIYTAVLNGPGEYQFVIGKEWGSILSFTREIPQQDTYRFDIELPLGSLSGVVRGPGGELLSKVSVTIVPHGNNFGETWPLLRGVETDEDGAFVFERLHPAHYVLRTGSGNIWGPREGADYGQALIADVHIKEGQRSEGLEINLRPEGTVKCTVRNSSGSPVFVAVTVKVAGDLNFDFWSNRKTDEFGRITISGLAAGPVRLIAELENGTRGEVFVDVVEGEEVEVELILN